MPQGLEDVSKVPSLVAELLRRGWTDIEVKAALGENLLRVLRKAEEVRWTLTRDKSSAEMKINKILCPSSNQIHNPKLTLTFLLKKNSNH